MTAHTLLQPNNKRLSGNSNDVKNYSFTDVTAFLVRGSTVYYRLKQTDLDGMFGYSNVIAIKKEMQTAGAPMQAFPNASASITLRLNQMTGLPSRQEVKVELLSITGRLLHRASVILDQNGLLRYEKDRYKAQTKVFPERSKCICNRQAPLSNGCG